MVEHSGHKGAEQSTACGSLAALSSHGLELPAAVSSWACPMGSTTTGSSAGTGRFFVKSEEAGLAPVLAPKNAVIDLGLEAAFVTVFPAVSAVGLLASLGVVLFFAWTERVPSGGRALPSG